MATLMQVELIKDEARLALARFGEIEELGIQLNRSTESYELYVIFAPGTLHCEENSVLINNVRAFLSERKRPADWSDPVTPEPLVEEPDHESY